jgi:ornithine decarboxylase
MQPYVASTPKIPIPFNRMLKIVAFVDASHRDVRLLLDLLEAERFEVEVRGDYGCDAAEDADAGAYLRRRRPAT